MTHTTRSGRRPLPPAKHAYTQRTPITIDPVPPADCEECRLRDERPWMTWPEIGFYTGMAIIAFVIIATVIDYTYAAGQASVVQQPGVYLP